jgi:hypothetical protein
MNSPVDRARFILVVEDQASPGDAPAGRRLARVLKGLLRWAGFRCREVRELPAPAPAASQGAGNASTVTDTTV